MDDAPGVWEDYIEKSLHQFASKTFEKVCMEYMYILNKKRELPLRFSRIGRWWGMVTKLVNGEKRTFPTEIDIIATDKEETKFIMGECKFKSELFDNGELRKFKDKMELPGKTYYFLFSLSGFTDAVIEASQRESNLFIVDALQIVDV